MTYSDSAFHPHVSLCRLIQFWAFWVTEEGWTLTRKRLTGETTASLHTLLQSIYVFKVKHHCLIWHIKHYSMCSLFQVKSVSDSFNISPIEGAAKLDISSGKHVIKVQTQNHPLTQTFPSFRHIS